MLHYKNQCSGTGYHFLWISPVSHWKRETLPKANLKHPDWASLLRHPFIWLYSGSTLVRIGNLCELSLLPIYKQHFLDPIEYSFLNWILAAHRLFQKPSHLCSKIHIKYIFNALFWQNWKGSFSWIELWMPILQQLQRNSGCLSSILSPSTKDNWSFALSHLCTKQLVEARKPDNISDFIRLYLLFQYFSTVSCNTWQMD